MASLRVLSVALISLALISCGGGGGGGSSSTATVEGTAAAGTPISGGTVTVIDATGKTVGTATTTSDGTFSLSFNPSNFTAPFVASVNGTVGQGSETYYSVLPTSPAAGTKGTLNLTPVSNAIASRMASTGSPQDLVDSIITEKANITASNLTAAEAAFRSFLDAQLAAVGLTSSFNLTSSVFNSNFDKLLDNVKFSVSPTGVITVSSSAGSAVNDMGDTATKPAEIAVASIPAGSNPSASDKSKIPVPPTGQKDFAASDIESARQALSACFKLPTAGRTNSNACTSLARSDYMNDGRTLQMEFGPGGAIDISSSGNDNLRIEVPELLRPLDLTPGSEKLLIRLTGLRADNTKRELVTVVKNNANGPGTGWILVGNGRSYNTMINASVTRRNSAATPSADRYTTALNIYIQAGVNSDGYKVNSAKVTGPGLPTGGLYLRQKTGCDWLTIVPLKLDNSTVNPDLGNSTANNDNNAYNNQVVPCSGLYTLQAVLISDKTSLTFSSNQWLLGGLTDTQVNAINEQDLYKFELTTSTGATVVYWNRLRSKPMLAKNVGSLRFVEWTDATKKMMNSGSSNFYGGGAAPTLSWTTPPNTALPFKAQFFHPAGSDQLDLPYGSGSATVPCTGNAECSNSGPNYVTTMGANLTTSSQYSFQLMTRNRNDLQIFTQLWR